MDFAPDGRSIVLGRLNGTLTIHETESGNELRRVRLDEPPFDLAMAGDGGRIAVSNPSGAVVIRDVVTGDVLRTLTVPGGVWTAAWHPEGELIAAASEDANVYLFSTRSGATHTVMRGHQAAVVHAAFVPSGNMLLTSSYDGTSRLWDVWTGRELLRWSGAAGSFSRDGGKVAIRAGYDFQIWELSSGREYRTLPAGQSPSGEHIQGGGVSLDGRLLAVSQGGHHKLWDLRSGAVAMIYAEPGAADARFHPTRNELFTSGRTGLFRWPVRDESNALRIGPPQRLRLSAPTGRIAFDRGGQTLAAADRGGAWILKLDKMDSQKLGVVTRIEHINAQVCALSPDGRWLATGTQNGFGVKVWNASTGELAIPEPLLPDERQTTVSFSPDGRWLVTGTETEFGIWEVGTWQLRRRIPKDQPVGRSQIAFTADGGILAIDVSNGVVLLLDPLTGGSLARLEPPEPLLISWMSFTTEGSELIVCAESGQIAVWDLRQIRAQLRAIELDWEPPLPTRGETRLPVVPITMDVSSGEIMRVVESLNHEVRAIEQESARNWPQVIDAYTKAISVDAENARARNNLAWLYLTGPTELRDDAKALTLAEDAVRLEPYRAEWLNTLGVAYYRTGQWEKAISTLELGVDAQGGQAMAFDLFFLAMSHYRLGHRERARELYHQALSWWRQQDLPAEWVKDLVAFRAEAEALLQLEQGR
jgi:WD40 repeat protein